MQVFKRWKGLRRGPVVLVLLLLVIVGAGSIAYAAPDKPDVFYRDGKRIHRGKLADTTNDKMIHGFPINQLPRVPPPPGVAPSGGDAIVGPTCGHPRNGGNECSVPTLDEVREEYSNYYGPTDGRKSSSTPTIQGQVAPEPKP